jgi:hypothetical protein
MTKLKAFLFFILFLSFFSLNILQAQHLQDKLLHSIYTRKQFVSQKFNEQYPVDLNDIAQVSWGAGKGQAPQLLFWENVSEYEHIKQKVNQIAAKKESQGIIPRMGLRMLQTTWKQSLPGGKLASLPGHKSWIQWVKERPELLGKNYQGKLFKDNSWGYISPLVPIDRKDYPDDFTGEKAYFMDWQADKLGRLAAFLGVRGIQFSDFFDSHPHTGLYNFFNERIMADFAETKNIPLKGTFRQKTHAIKSKYYQEWLDYFVDRWAENWATLARSIKKHTAKKPLLITQVSHQPAVSRRYGAVDVREILKHMSPDNILFAVQTLQPFSMNKRYVPSSYEATVLGMYAAREPEAYYAHVLSASEKNYWDAVSQIWSNLSPGTQQELGWKRLKRIWIESGWVHIANRDGSVRRAFGAYMPFYHSLGEIKQEWVQMIHDIVPVRPFGAAYYYSVGIERQIEKRTTGKSLGFKGAYLYSYTFDKVTKHRENGIPVNYYVSDVATSSLLTKNHPTAWILPQRYDEYGKDLLPVKERKILEQIAPIYSEKNINQLVKQPLAFNNKNKRNITGFGFYDNKDRLIVVVSDAINENSSEQDIKNFSVLINLILPQGQYKVEDYLGKDAKIITSNGEAKININLERWDTNVLVVNRVKEKSNNQVN